MGATETTTGARVGAILERPGVLLLGLVAAYLVLDFVAKLAFFELWIAGVKVLGGEVTLSTLATLVWNGIVVGLGIGLAGIGLSMTYSILGFANFAHGDYITAGGFAGWATSFLIAGLATGQGSLGFLLSVGFGSGPSAGDLNITALKAPIAFLSGDPVTTAVVGSSVAVFAGLVVAILASIGLVLLVDRVIYRPMRDQGAIALLIASIGVALALRYLIVFVFGGGTRGLTGGSGAQLRFGGEGGQLFGELVAADRGAAGQRAVIFDLQVPFVRVGDYTADIVSMNAHEVTLVVVAVMLMGGLHLLLQRTKLGTAMRAMADNEDLARITGIPTERVIFATWVIGGGLAGAAGYLITLERGTLVFNFGWLLLLLIFAAVILGGIGSVYGAMAGGIVIGLTREVSLVWIPSSFATAAAFVIMILMLLYRPDGLFGGVTTA